MILLYAGERIGGWVIHAFVANSIGRKYLSGRSLRLLINHSFVVESLNSSFSLNNTLFDCSEFVSSIKYTLDKACMSIGKGQRGTSLIILSYKSFFFLSLTNLLKHILKETLVGPSTT
jgi:hypothetical protein